MNHCQYARSLEDSCIGWNLLLAGWKALKQKARRMMNAAKLELSALLKNERGKVRSHS